MDDEIILIKESNPHTDENGNAVFDIEERTVMCRVQSLSQSEYFKAVQFIKTGQLGLESSYKFTTFKGNYEGERKLIYHGKELVIYRTYETSDDDIELYAWEKEGAIYVE